MEAFGNFIRDSDSKTPKVGEFQSITAAKSSAQQAWKHARDPQGTRSTNSATQAHQNSGNFLAYDGQKIETALLASRGFQHPALSEARL